MSARVILLCGGTWDEREISLQSAAEVLEALRDGGLTVEPVRWDLAGWTALGPDATDLHAPGNAGSAAEVIAELQTVGNAALFNCLHGGPGEDGTLQGFLEVLGVPYTGASVHGSAITGDKQSFRVAAAAMGAEVASAAIVPQRAFEKAPDRVLEIVSVEVGLPAMVKPLRSGSSYGVLKCDTPEAVQAALEASFVREQRVLVERYIPGREISVPCLGTRPGSAPESLPVIEIEPLTDSGFFDPEAKYVEGRAREVVPAPIEDDVARHVTDLSLRIHDELDLGGVSRTDFILGADGPVVLESQTVPGFTSGSLLPLSARSVGLDLTGLCRRLLDYALAAHLARGVPAPSTKP